MDTNTNNKILRTEKILLNLKIIGNIKSKDKLSSNNQDVLEIEANDIIQGVRRWWYSRSRDLTISTIRKTIQDSFEITDNALDNEKLNTKANSTFYDNTSKNTYFNEENSSLLQRFLLELTSANKGLDNLKITYISDTRIVSEIELLQQQIKLRIAKINGLLKIDNQGFKMDTSNVD